MELDISFSDWRQRIPYSWHERRKRWTRDILKTNGFFGNVQAPLKFSKVRRSALYVILAGQLLSQFSNEVKDRVLLQSAGPRIIIFKIRVRRNQSLAIGKL